MLRVRNQLVRRLTYHDIGVDVFDNEIADIVYGTLSVQLEWP